MVVGQSPATDSSMNVRKTGCAYSCEPMRKVCPGCILPQNPLGLITFRRSRLDTNLHPCPTGATASIYSQGLPDQPQDLLPSRNRAFMGFPSTIRSSPTTTHFDQLQLAEHWGGVAQDAGAVARYWHRTKVHPVAWQRHISPVRHRSLRK